MKKCFLTVFFFLLAAASGCRQKTEKRETSVTHEEATKNSTVYSSHPVVSTEEGYYFLNRGYLYYMDQNAEVPIVVCSQPNCMHSDNSCNACIGGDDILLLYEDKLYYRIFKGLSTAVMSVDLRGEVRTELMTVPTSELASTMIIHRGCIYYIRYNQGKNTYSLYAFDLDEKTQECLYTASEMLEPVYAMGNQLFLNRTFTDENGNLRGDSICWNIEEKAAEKVFVISGEKEQEVPVDYQLMYGAHGRLYGTSYENPEDIEEETSLFFCDMDGGNRRIIGSFPRDLHEMDDTYLYYMDGSALIIMDENGEELRREVIELEEDNREKEILGVAVLGINCVNTDRVFLHAWLVQEAEEDDTETITAILSLKLDEDGGFEVIDF